MKLKVATNVIDQLKQHYTDILYQYVNELISVCTHCVVEPWEI